MESRPMGRVEATGWGENGRPAGNVGTTKSAKSTKRGAEKSRKERGAGKAGSAWREGDVRRAKTASVGKDKRGRPGIA